MINEAVTAVSGVMGGTMVSYILSFFLAIGTLYLVVKGMTVSWDILKTSYLALRIDMRQARTRGVSVFGIWKERVRASLPANQQ